jgi:hypothetical protein
VTLAKKYLNTEVVLMVRTLFKTIELFIQIIAVLFLLLSLPMLFLGSVSTSGPAFIVAIISSVVMIFFHCLRKARVGDKNTVRAGITSNDIGRKSESMMSSIKIQHEHVDRHSKLKTISMIVGIVSAVVAILIALKQLGQ